MTLTGGFILGISGILAAVCIAANEARKSGIIQPMSDDPFEDCEGDWPNLSEISVSHSGTSTTGCRHDHGARG